MALRPGHQKTMDHWDIVTKWPYRNIYTYNILQLMTNYEVRGDDDEVKVPEMI